MKITKVAHLQIDIVADSDTEAQTKIVTDSSLNRSNFDLIKGAGTVKL